MLILVAHGSRNPRWQESVERLADSLQAELGDGTVRVAYMQFTSPTLADVVNEAVDAGARRIRVLPLFVTAEGHVDRDIRPEVERLDRERPRVQIELLPPVGQHPLFLAFLRKIAREDDTERGSGTLGT